MGWDANAVFRKSSPEYPAIMEDFSRVAFLVTSRCKTVDGMLKEGTLGMGDCARVIEWVTDHNPYDEKGWSPEKVREVLMDFDPMKYKEFSKEDRWSFWSTYWFLVVCSKHNLSVSFSF